MALEYRFGDIDGNGTNNAVADIAIFLILAKELFDGAGNSFTKGYLMGTTLDGVLTIDEGVVLLARLVGMGERNLNILAFEVNDRVERIYRHIVGQEVEKTILGGIFVAVVIECESSIEVGIVAHHGLDELIAEVVVLE